MCTNCIQIKYIRLNIITPVILNLNSLTVGDAISRPEDETSRSQSPACGKNTPEGSTPEPQRKVKPVTELDNRTSTKYVHCIGGITPAFIK